MNQRRKAVIESDGLTGAAKLLLAACLPEPLKQARLLRRQVADPHHARAVAHPRGRARRREPAPSGERVGHSRRPAALRRAAAPRLAARGSLGGLCHAGVKLDLSLNDGFIDLVKHDIDGAVRIRHLTDSTQVARHLRQVRRAVVTSLANVAAARRRRSLPRIPQDLTQHPCTVHGEMRRRNLLVERRHAAKVRAFGEHQTPGGRTGGQRGVSVKPWHGHALGVGPWDEPARRSQDLPSHQLGLRVAIPSARPAGRLPIARP